MRKLLFMIVCITGMSSAYAQGIKESLDAKTFKSKLDATPNAVLLDVRTQEEVSKGEIPGAVNIDFNSADFTQKVAALDKTKTYFVYCAKGGRSSKAVEQMNLAGFKTLYNLEDGYVGWKEKGFPITKK